MHKGKISGFTKICLQPIDMKTQKALLLAFLVIFSANTPFWVVANAQLVIETGYVICKTENHFIFQKNKITGCLVLENSSQVKKAIKQLAKKSSPAKYILANQKKQYIQPDILINNEGYLLKNILYYKNQEILKLELEKEKKYYIFTVNFDSFMVKTLESEQP